MKTLDSSMLSNAKKFYNQISVVKDALTAYRTGGVHAMHDPTEGGVVGGIHEMAAAWNRGAKVFEDRIVVEPETAKICRFFEGGPVQLISSGALLIAAEAEKVNEIIENLMRGRIYAARVGRL